MDAAGLISREIGGDAAGLVSLIPPLETDALVMREVEPEGKDSPFKGFSVKLTPRPWLAKGPAISSETSTWGAAGRRARSAGLILDKISFRGTVTVRLS